MKKSTLPNILRPRLAHSLSLLLCLSFFGLNASAAEPPNMLLIITDDQGHDDLGARGRADLQTPFMDQLYREGVRFEPFYTEPSCAPTRASLLTGRDHRRSGISHVDFGKHYVNRELAMLPEVLREGGYRTYMFGKWHLGEAEGYAPWSRGFDEAWMIGDENRSSEKHAHFNAPVWKNGKFVRTEGWIAELMTDRVIEIIKEADTKPFFIYLAYNEPHGPWIPPQKHYQAARDRGLSHEEALLVGMIDFNDAQIGRILDAIQTRKNGRETMVVFLGDNGPTPQVKQGGDLWRVKDEPAVAHAAATFNKDVALSKEEWAANNPSGLRGKKAEVWENGIRNNLIFWNPRRWKPGVIEVRTHVADVPVTLIDLALGKTSGLSDPDGLSLAPALESGDVESLRQRKPLLVGKPERIPASGDDLAGEDGWIDLFDTRRLGFHQTELALFEGDYKLVHSGKNFALFHIANDPNEENDLAAKDPERAKRMEEEMRTRFAEVLADPHAYAPAVSGIGPGGGYVQVLSAEAVRGSVAVNVDRIDFKAEGAQARLLVDVAEAGTYKVSTLGNRDAEYRAFQLEAGDHKAALTRERDWDPLVGEIELSAGKQTLLLTLTGHDPGKRDKYTPKLFALNFEKLP